MDDESGVFAHFGVPPVASCYRYAPVFRTVIAGRPAAVKRTSRGLGPWLRALVASGVPVVAPLDLPMANPVTLGDQEWVAYPWIDGRPYDGSAQDIAAAGDLLGRIHSAGFTDGVEAFSWPDHDAASVEEDVTGLRRVLPELPELPQLEARVAAFMTATLPPIRDAGLPVAAVPLDFKAANLVYTPAGPVLVDPDNAEVAPRLLDLANAVLLFHNDARAGRLFTAGEWAVFRQAYRRHVTLTPDEQRLWPVAVRYMHLEWAVWSLIAAEGWGEYDDPVARAFLLDLAATKEDRFPLEG